VHRVTHTYDCSHTIIKLCILSEKSSSQVHLLGKSADKQITVRGTVASDLGDAGYNSTAIMIAECALVLVLQEQSAPVKGGVLTSAAALGMPAVERLRKAGFTMSVAEAKGPKTKRFAKLD
jgi:short subunit dehydrogenase-like uncharacterized protein